MDPLAANPFAVLTFIAAPAVLINASSVMALGTSNRFARAVDRARQLSAQIDQGGRADDPEVQRRVRLLGYTERRCGLLVRALTAFYLAVGAFAAASLAALVGAIAVAFHLDTPRDVAWWVALPSGVVGVVGLVSGAALLVWETRMTLAILREETARLRDRLAGRDGPLT